MPTIDWNFTYIISQVITAIFYGLLTWSYFLKTKKSIIIVGTISVLLNAVVFILLGAWTGLAMCIVALVRNLVCYLADNKSHDKKHFGTSWLFFIIILLAIITVTIPTYDGFLSLMSVFATTLYSYSIWQKKPIVYKLCGVPVGILWIIYNIYIVSLFGIVLESGLTVFVLVSLAIEQKNGRLNQAH